MNIKVTHKLDVDTYRYLRSYLLKTNMTDEQIQYSLSNSRYEVLIYDNDKPIAMGRLLGDGIYYYMITEVVVIPDYQGKKIGTRVINELLAFVKEHSTKETYVYLMSAKNKEKFYNKFGFVSRPNEQFGPGMILRMNKEN